MAEDKILVSCLTHQYILYKKMFPLGIPFLDNITRLVLYTFFSPFLKFISISLQFSN